MKFLKQLLDEVSNTIPEDSNKSCISIDQYKDADTSSFSLFVAEVAKVKSNPPVTIKPRNKPLNDALISKKSGAIPSDKTDYSRAQEKQKLHKEINEVVQELPNIEDDPNMKYFLFTAWKAGKPAGSGRVKNLTPIDARKQVMLKHTGVDRVELKEISADQYYQRNNSAAY